MTYEFDKMKGKKIQPGDLVVMIGKRKSGKSTVLADLLYSLRYRKGHTEHPEVTLFQPTYKTNRMFHSVVPSTFAHTTFDEKVVRKIMKRQEERVEKAMETGKEVPYHILIFDDCGGLRGFTKSPVMEELASNGRHYKMTIFITVQYPLQVPPEIRGNCDWVFALKDINPKNRKLLTEHYFGQLEKDFDRVFNTVTENRGCLVLNATGQSTNPEKNHFVFRAKVREYEHEPQNRNNPKWRLGSPKYWKYHYRFLKKKSTKVYKKDTVTV
jgi:hypothetical protein